MKSGPRHLRRVATTIGLCMLVCVSLWAQESELERSRHPLSIRFEGEELKITHAAYLGYNFQLEKSSDGHTWQPVGEEYAGTSTLHTHSFQIEEDRRALYRVKRSLSGIILTHDFEQGVVTGQLGFTQDGLFNYYTEANSTVRRTLFFKADSSNWFEIEHSMAGMPTELVLQDGRTVKYSAHDSSGRSVLAQVFDQEGRELSPQIRLEGVHDDFFSNAFSDDGKLWSSVLDSIAALSVFDDLVDFRSSISGGGLAGFISRLEEQNHSEREYRLAYRDRFPTKPFVQGNACLIALGFASGNLFAAIPVLIGCAGAGNSIATYDQFAADFGNAAAELVYLAEERYAEGLAILEEPTNAVLGFELKLGFLIASHTIIRDDYTKYESAIQRIEQEILKMRGLLINLEHQSPSYPPYHRISSLIKDLEGKILLSVVYALDLVRQFTPLYEQGRDNILTAIIPGLDQKISDPDISETDRNAAIMERQEFQAIALSCIDQDLATLSEVESKLLTLQNRLLAK